MIESYKKLRFYLKADAIMNEQVFPQSRLQRIFFPSVIELFLRTMRKYEYYWYKVNRNKLYAPLWLFYKIKYRKLSIKTGFDIPINTFGYGVRIAHLSTIVINAHAKIGNYCNISNGLVIADSIPKKIGDFVFFGSNVVVNKDVCIADGCKISSLTLMNKSAVIPNQLWGG